MTMPAGRYFIGDLCYCLHDVWNEFCELTIRGERCLEGEFVLQDGRRFASFATAYGDGEYLSSINTSHSVDSGSIGCIRVEDIRDNEYTPEFLAKLGAFVEFDQPFEVSNDQGMLTFGHVQIETAGGYDEEEEDYFSEEE